MRLTAEQAYALRLIREYEERAPGQGCGVLPPNEQTRETMQEPWINLHTVIALERRGLVTCDWDIDGSTVYLPAPVTRTEPAE